LVPANVLQLSIVNRQEREFDFTNNNIISYVGFRQVIQTHIICVFLYFLSRRRGKYTTQTGNKIAMLFIKYDEELISSLKQSHIWG
jgi:hypothetical protein